MSRRFHGRRAPAAVVAVLLVGFLPHAAAAQTGAGADVLAPPTVTAEGAVLWEPVDGRSLVGVRPGRPRPMASTTKIMTVLLALEEAALDEQITVSEHAAAVGREQGVATFGLQPGQQVRMGDALAGLVLRSGNDAAVAVAEHVAGSEEAFVTRMNVRAEGLGLDATHFVNATGLTDDLDHHASPRDLARLAAVAMEDPDFAAWAGAQRLDVGDLGVLENRNELLGAYPGATGVKTGYTALAGLCLVASARREGRTLYAVVLDSGAHFDDAAKLLDHGSEAYRLVRAITPEDELVGYRLGGAVARLTVARPLARTVAASRTAAVRTRLVLRPAVTPPVRAGASAGEAQLLVGDRVQARVPLVFDEDLSRPAPQNGAAAVGGAIRESLRTLARLRPVTARR